MQHALIYKYATLPLGKSRITSPSSSGAKHPGSETVECLTISQNKTEIHSKYIIYN